MTACSMCYLGSHLYRKQKTICTVSAFDTPTHYQLQHTDKGCRSLGKVILTSSKNIPSITSGLV